MSASPAPLTAGQTHALFDILIHHQLYAEIEAFKYPSTLDHYGYPFHKADGVQTTSPLLQHMHNKFALTNPAIRRLGPDYWQDRVRVLVAKLADAELSESYDKGAIGSRKALATAASSIGEYMARGMLGGYPVAAGSEPKAEYDASKPADVLQAWDDCMRGFIYGQLLARTADRVRATDRLDEHASVVQAAHEYILLNVASFLHHVFVMSPDGQYLVRLLDNMHRLIPYYMIKQTLRLGNAASMINAMVKLVLAKLSVTAMTNWIGLTNNSNDGMNLLQQIISTILAWDTAEFAKRAHKLESSRDAPDKKAFKAIKAFVYASRDKHEAARSMSIQESKSIVAVILESADKSIDAETLSEAQHDVAMEYYSICLSIRDREELTKIVCKSQPDVLTSALREAVTAMDPVIRAIHNAVDLSGTVTDAENFIADLIKISKPKKKSGSKSRASSPTPASITDTEPTDAPTVEEYVQLVRKHAPSVHRFLHQVAKNAPDLANDYLEYVQTIFSEFRVNDMAKAAEEKGQGGAGNMTAPLHSLFSTLPQDKQDDLKKLLDEHEAHLQQLKQTSHDRLRSIMRSTATDGSSSKSNQKGTRHGPGMYLSRWNALLDSTLITPATVHGPVRRGWEVKGELDGKGLKTNSSVGNANKRAQNNERGGSGVDADDDADDNDDDNGDDNNDDDGAGGHVAMAEGLGDETDRRERRRDGEEEDRMVRVWESMRDGWVGVCRGLEVMGD